MDTFHVYRMRFDWLQALPGCRDAHVREKARAFLAQFEDVDSDLERDDAEPTSAQALDDILDGRIPTDVFGSDAYPLALSAVYWTCTKHADVLNLSSAGKYFSAVDEALLAAGAGPPLSLTDLAFRGAPFHLPSSDTNLGYLSNVEVDQAYAIYDRLSLIALPKDARGTVERFGSWLKAASKDGHALAGVLA
jgi:hypothetical protein